MLGIGHVGMVATARDLLVRLLLCLDPECK